MSQEEVEDLVNPSHRDNDGDNLTKRPHILARVYVVALDSELEHHGAIHDEEDAERHAPGPSIGKSHNIVVSRLPRLGVLHFFTDVLPPDMDGRLTLLVRCYAPIFIIIVPHAVTTIEDMRAKACLPSLTQLPFHLKRNRSRGIHFLINRRADMDSLCARECACVVDMLIGP